MYFCDIEFINYVIVFVSRKKPDIKYINPRKGDIIYSQAYISLAKNSLGHNPKIELRERTRQLLNL